MEFTQEIKDKWLIALKSGKYTQIKKCFISNQGHCCLAVLAEEVCEGNYPDFLPFQYRQDLIHLNDDTFDENKPDYSNVISLIETLPVKN
jgi:hypothetical protein